MFADVFGKVHIGTNKNKSSHSRVTELDFIRWRATLFGTPGQRVLAAIRSRSVRTNTTIAAANTEDTATPVAARGKFCSNTS